ncbi:uncharacterized protein LOC131605545 [Vicia villosa]|uniref:uncharacterized protein LOC131605545 n=1 Tax=Vicia villosa TaxID=3911 RepID=UPI00273C378A|nr:uncharacterized protein LOC131605545 [Vicia villosa]
MDQSYSNGSSNSFEISSVPQCGCRMPMKMWVANTVQNKNRKFWKCRLAGGLNSCDLFLWDDEFSTAMSESTKSENRDYKKCNVALVKLEITVKKLEKTKLKVSIMQKKIYQTKLAFMLCLIMFAVVLKFKN